MDLKKTMKNTTGQMNHSFTRLSMKTEFNPNLSLDENKLELLGEKKQIISRDEISLVKVKQEQQHSTKDIREFNTSLKQMKIKLQNEESKQDKLQSEIEKLQSTNQTTLLTLQKMKSEKSEEEKNDSESKKTRQLEKQIEQQNAQIQSLESQIIEKKESIKQIKEQSDNLVYAFNNSDILGINPDSSEKLIIKSIEHYNPGIIVTPKQVSFTKQLIELISNPISQEKITNMKKENEFIIKRLLNKSSENFYQNKNRDDENQDEEENNEFAYHDYYDKEEEEEQGQFISDDEIIEQDQDGYDEYEKKMKILMIMQKFSQQQGIDMYLTDQEMDHSKSQMMKNNLLLTGCFQEAQYYTLNLHLQNQRPLTPKQIHDQIPTLKQYVHELKGNTSESKSNDIIVMAIQNDIINHRQSIHFSTRGATPKTSTQGQLHPYLSIQNKSLLQNSLLSADMFDSRFDEDWKSCPYDKTTRGALMIGGIETPQDYFFPKNFNGYGLRVVEKYGEEDQEWLGMGDTLNTWIVLFHGTDYDHIESIIQNNLKTGTRDAQKGHFCRITNQTINMNASHCYLTDQAEIAKGYSKKPIPLNGKKYKIVFQCRVNPLKVQSPRDKPQFYLVENPQYDVRPYRILLQEVPYQKNI